MSIVRSINVLIATLVLGPLSVASQPFNGERGPEIWVDGPVQPAADPINPDVAVAADGTSIFVWDADLNNVTDNDIYLRRFDANGQAIENAQFVNTLDASRQTYPRIAQHPDGSFLVVWQSSEPDLSSPRVVRGQAFDADAVPMGSEQLISEVSSLSVTEISADVAALSNGNYIVVWGHSFDAKMDDADGSIQGRLLSPTAAPIGDQFQVNETAFQVQGQPTVAPLIDGGFVVVWIRPDLHGRRFAADGSPVGGNFLISTTTEGTETQPDIALGSDGRLLVVWTDSEQSLEVTEIRGRLYSSMLDPETADFRINNLTASGQNDPAVAAYGQGQYFVAWTSAVSGGSDSSERSIQGRVVNGANSFITTQFQLNDWIQSVQQLPGIGSNGDRATVAWRSLGGDADGNLDGNTPIITAEQWNACGIFCDSFEG